MNLDPAATHVPFGCHIDIRDTVDYKQVMTQYGLGPNGAILTSLNLFCTRFDQVADLIEAKLPALQYVLADTPGQIEVFNWSASGTIIAETLASLTPTVIVYVVDAARCASPVTFMANMLYACGVMYRARLPMVVALNKSDAGDAAACEEWMRDLDAFQAALDAEAAAGAGSGNGGAGGGGTGYITTLSRSMALVLAEFYAGIAAVPVSAVTGEGINEMFDAIYEAAETFDVEYAPLLERARKERAAGKEKDQAVEMEKLQRDMAAASVDDAQRKRQERRQWRLVFFGFFWFFFCRSSLFKYDIRNLSPFPLNILGLSRVLEQYCCCCCCCFCSSCAFFFSNSLSGSGI
jgi:GTPase SAR1 family protein